MKAKIIDEAKRKLVERRIMKVKIYTHISKKAIDKIVNPIDDIYE